MGKHSISDGKGQRRVVLLDIANAVIVDDSDLKPVSNRPPIKEYLSKLLQRRFFIWEEAKGRTSTNNRDMILGRLWNVLNPLIDAGMYGIIFGFLLKTSKGVDNFIGYLVLGMVFFSFLTQGLNGGAGLIQRSRGLISSFSFPRAALVFSATTKNFLENVTPALVAICFALAFQIRNGISWTIVLVVPLFLLMHIFACGVSLIVARLTAFVPDLQALIRIVARFWFYSSGVFFSVTRLSSSSTVQKILEMNPGYQFLYMVRSCVLYHQVPNLFHWIYVTLWSVGLLAFGLVFFWRAESRYINVK